MDIGKVFVLVATAFVIGILAYLELKSRRQRQEAQAPATEKPEADLREVARKR